MTNNHTMSRRQFLITTTTVGSAFVLGFHLPLRKAEAANIAGKPWTPPLEGGNEVNAWLIIGNDDSEAIRKLFPTVALRSRSLLAVMKRRASAGGEPVQHKMYMTDLDHGRTRFYTALIVLAVPTVPAMPGVRPLNHPAFFLILSDFGVHSFRPPIEEAMSRLWSQLR